MVSKENPCLSVSIRGYNSFNKESRNTEHKIKHSNSKFLTSLLSHNSVQGNIGKMPVLQRREVWKPETSGCGYFTVTGTTSSLRPRALIKRLPRPALPPSMPTLTVREPSEMRTSGMMMLSWMSVVILI
jgi:hypothetical protein